MWCPHSRPPARRGVDRATINAARSTRTALPSSRLGATTTRPGPTHISPCNMRRGQVPDHYGGGLTPLARLTAGALTNGATNIVQLGKRAKQGRYGRGPADQGCGMTRSSCFWKRILINSKERFRTRTQSRRFLIVTSTWTILIRNFKNGTKSMRNNLNSAFVLQ